MQPSTLLLTKLPRPWIGCVTALQSRHGVLENLERWLGIVEQSKQHGKLCWEGLLKSLTQNEPCSTDQGLEFYDLRDCSYTISFPLLLHLPAVWQCHLLSFIYRHRQRITQHALRHFLSALELSLKEKKLAIKSQVPDEGQIADNQNGGLVISSDKACTSATEANKFTWTNFWINKLWKFLQYSDRDKSIPANAERHGKSEHYNFCARFSELKNSILSVCEAESVKQNPWSNLLLHAKDGPSYVNQSMNDLDGSVFGTQRMIPSPGTPGHPGDVSMYDSDTQDLPLSKRLRLSRSVCDSAEDSQNSSQSQVCHVVAGISSQYVDSIQILKSAWHSDCAEVKAEDLIMFTQCPVTEIQKICLMLDLAALPDDNLATVVMAISSLKEQLALSHAAVLAEHFLLEKVLKLSGSASRNLQQACVSLVEAYPTAVISSVLTPTLLNPGVGAPQCDLVIKLLRDTIDANHKQSLIRAYVEELPTVHGAVLPVLQHIVDTKTALDDKTLSGLVAMLNSSSADFTDNLKFGKLVLGLVKQYNGQLTSHHVGELDQAVTAHKTFLKKSIVAALKKVSQS